MKKILLLLILCLFSPMFRIHATKEAALGLKSTYPIKLSYQLRQLLPMHGASAYEKHALSNFYTFGHSNLDEIKEPEPLAADATEEEKNSYKEQKKTYSNWLKQQNNLFQFIRRMFHLIPGEELQLGSDLKNTLEELDQTEEKANSINEIAHNIAVLLIKKHIISTHNLNNKLISTHNLNNKQLSQITQILSYSKKLSKGGATLLNKLTNEDEYDVAITAHLGIVWLIYKKNPNTDSILIYIKALKEALRKSIKTIEENPKVTFLNEETKKHFQKIGQELESLKIILPIKEEQIGTDEDSIRIEQKKYTEEEITKQKAILAKKYGENYINNKLNPQKEFSTSNWEKDLVTLLIETSRQDTSIPKKISYQTISIANPENISFSFSNCMETVIRNLVNMLAFDPETKLFNAKRLTKRVKSVFPNAEPIEALAKFYEKYPNNAQLTSKDIAQNAANDWTTIVSFLPNLDYVNKDNYELEPTITNAILSLNYLLGLNLTEDKTTEITNDLDIKDPESVETFIRKHFNKILQLFSKNNSASTSDNYLKKQIFSFSYEPELNIKPYIFTMYLNSGHGSVSIESEAKKRILYCSIDSNSTTSYDPLIWFFLTNKSFSKNPISSKTPYLSIFGQNIEDPETIKEIIEEIEQIPERFFALFDFLIQKHHTNEQKERLLLKLVKKSLENNLSPKSLIRCIEITKSLIRKEESQTIFVTLCEKLNQIKDRKNKQIIEKHVTSFFLNHKEKLSNPENDYLYWSLLSQILPFINDQELIKTTSKLIEEVPPNFFFPRVIQGLLPKKGFNTSKKTEEYITTLDLDRQLYMYNMALKNATPQSNPELIVKSIDLAKKNLRKREEAANLLATALTKYQLIKTKEAQEELITYALDRATHLKNKTKALSIALALVEIQPKITNTKIKYTILESLAFDLLTFKTLNKGLKKYRIALLSRLAQPQYQPILKQILTIPNENSDSDSDSKSSDLDDSTNPKNGFKNFYALINTINKKNNNKENLNNLLILIQVGIENNFTAYTLNAGINKIIKHAIELTNESDQKEILNKTARIIDTLIKRDIEKTDEIEEQLIEMIDRIFRHLDKLNQDNRTELIKKIFQLTRLEKNRLTEDVRYKLNILIKDVLDNVTILTTTKGQKNIVLALSIFAAENLKDLAIFEKLQNLILETQNPTLFEWLTEKHLNVLKDYVGYDKDPASKKLKPILNSLLWYNQNINLLIKKELLETLEVLTEQATAKGNKILKKSTYPKIKLKNLIQKLESFSKQNKTITNTKNKN